jgi:hypothetical protein
MLNNQQHQTPGQKKPYQKPALSQIPLRPDEAVLGSCKKAGSSGPGGMGGCTPVGNCFGQGS